MKEYNLVKLPHLEEKYLSRIHSLHTVLLPKKKIAIVTEDSY